MHLQRGLTPKLPLLTTFVRKDQHCYEAPQQNAPFRLEEFRRIAPLHFLFVDIRIWSGTEISSEAQWYCGCGGDTTPPTGEGYRQTSFLTVR